VLRRGCHRGRHFCISSEQRSASGLVALLLFVPCGYHARPGSDRSQRQGLRQSDCIAVGCLFLDRSGSLEGNAQTPTKPES